MNCARLERKATSDKLFDLLARFAEIEWLVAKIYFRFSHLFLDHPELRDFWWEMATEEDQHGSILLACKTIIENYDQLILDPTINQEKAEELKARLLCYLSHGTPSLSGEEAFRIAIEIESSEVDAIYSKLLRIGGPSIAKTIESLGVPVTLQRHKLKLAIRQFCTDPELVAAAERL